MQTLTIHTYIITQYYIYCVYMVSHLDCFNLSNDVHVIIFMHSYMYPALV